MTEALNNSQTEERKAFKFDVANIEADIDVSTDATNPRILSARMTKPTKDDLVKKEAMTLTEVVEANATEDDVVVEHERGSAWLFDKITTHVKGVRLKNEDKSAVGEWREYTDELKELIPSSFKAAFISTIYNLSAKFVDGGEEGVVLGGDDLLSVDLTLGSEDNPVAVIRFDVPEPEETERRNYSRDATQIRQPKGSRKTRTRIITNIGAAVKFFDLLMKQTGAAIYIPDSETAVTVGGKTFAEISNPVALAQFLDAIDPVYKRAVVSALMSKYNAKVSE